MNINSVCNSYIVFFMWNSIQLIMVCLMEIYQRKAASYHISYTSQTLKFRIPGSQFKLQHITYFTFQFV